MFTTPTQEEINAVMKRLGEIGWITSSVQVKSKGKMKLTEKGALGLTSLGVILTELGTMTPGQFSALVGLSIKRLEDQIDGIL